MAARFVPPTGKREVMIRKVGLILGGLALALIGTVGSAAHADTTLNAAARTQPPSVASPLNGWVQLPDEKCAPRTSPRGARAYICSSFGFWPDGTTVGYYRGTAEPGTLAQIRVDGSHRNAATHPDFRGVFSNVRSVTFRVCIVDVECGPWS